MVITLGYLAGVFLVSLVNARYFAPAWLTFLPVLFVPLDLLLRLVFRPLPQIDSGWACGALRCSSRRLC
jgi:hypothetical protein